MVISKNMTASSALTVRCCTRCQRYYAGQGPYCIHCLLVLAEPTPIYDRMFEEFEVARWRVTTVG